MSEEREDIEKFSDSEGEAEDHTENNQSTYLKKKKKNVGKIINKLLQKDLKKQVVQLINQNPILAKNRTQIKKIDAEKQVEKEEKAKVFKKLEQRKRGYKEGNLWDLKKEKVLLKIATKGVVKLFNSINEHRNKLKDEEKEQEIKSKKKSNNFLQMHNLSNPEENLKKLKPKKRFSEDVEPKLNEDGDNN